VMPVDRERFTHAGFDGCIMKPIDVKSFPGEILAYCNGARGGR
jgi:hypothetical protein